MFRALITSDLHLDPHIRRTPTKKFRLNQNYLIIENLIKAATKEGALDAVFLAGDIVEKPNRDAVTHQVVKDCMEELSRSFKTARYILGNHDMISHSVGSESTEYDAELSYLPLYMPEKFVYSDKSIIEVEGLRIGFRNYSSSSELDLSFIEKPVDILIGHSSQIYLDDESNCPFAAQVYDDSLVKGTAFWGHIHQSTSKGKNVSIGVPQRCHTSDDKPQAIILEINNGTYRWKHILVDPEKTQMDIVEDFDIDADYYDEKTNSYHVAKKAKTYLYTNVSDKLKELGSSESVLMKYVELNDLIRCFGNIKDHTSLEDAKKLNLYFTTKSLKIHNWRSIADAEFQFEENGKYYVSGANGAGKSSFLTALKFAISGETATGETKSFIRRGCKDMWVEVELVYEGNEYKIHRGTDMLFIEENGNRLELGDKNTSKKKIKEILPFSTAMDLMFFGKDNPSVLRGADGSGNTAKIELFARLLGLTEIEAYNKTAIDRKKEIEPELKYKESAFTDKYGQLGEKEIRLMEIKESLGNPIDVDQELERLGNEYNNLKSIVTNYQEEQQRINSAQGLITKCKSEEHILEQYKLDLTAYKDQTWYTSQMEQLKQQYTTIQQDLDQLQKLSTKKLELRMQLGNLYTECSNLTNTISNLTVDDAPICNTYGVACPLVTPELRQKAYQDKKTNLENELKTKSTKYSELLSEYEAQNVNQETINEKQTQLANVNSELMTLRFDLNKLEETKSKIQRQTSEVDKLKTQLQSLGVTNITIQLPENIMETMDNINTNIIKLRDYKRELQQFIFTKQESEKEKLTITELRAQFQDLQKFIEITKTSGPVYEEILSNVMKGFSDNNYQYTLDARSSGRGRSMAITAKHINHDGLEIYYASGSGGETSMMDVHFLSALSRFTGFGLLVLDELLGYVDATNHDLATEMIKNLDGVGQLFFISHKDNQVPIFENVIECEKSNSGETHYSL